MLKKRFFKNTISLMTAMLLFGLVMNGPLLAETAESVTEMETETETLSELETEADTGNVSLSQYLGLIFTIEDPEDRSMQEAIVTEYLLKTCVVGSLPEDRLQEQTAKIRTWYEQAASFYNMSLDDFIEVYYEMDAKAFEEQAKETAAENLTRELIFEAVAKAEGLKAGKDNLEQVVLDYLIASNEFEAAGEAVTDGDTDVMSSQEALAEDSSRILSDRQQRSMTLHERLAALEQELGIDAEGKSTIERVEAIKKDLDMETQQYSIWAMLDEVEERMYGPFIERDELQITPGNQPDSEAPEKQMPEPILTGEDEPVTIQAEPDETEVAATESSETDQAQSESGMAETTEYTDGTTVYLVQQALLALGYDCEKTDGILGNKTVRAIMAFENVSGLPMDGKITDDLLEALNIKKPGER